MDEDNVSVSEEEADDFPQTKLWFVANFITILAMLMFVAYNVLVGFERAEMPILGVEATSPLRVATIAVASLGVGSLICLGLIILRVKMHERGFSNSPTIQDAS